MVQRAHHGLSLVEVSVALLILSMVIAATIGLFSASEKSSDDGEAKDALTEDSLSIIGFIERDLTASGWHFADRVDADEPVAAPDDASLYLTFDPSAGGWNDRGLYRDGAGPLSYNLDRYRHYYPFVQRQPSGSATASSQLGGSKVSAFPNRYDWSHTHRFAQFLLLGPLPSNVGAERPIEQRWLSLPGNPWVSAAQPGDHYRDMTAEEERRSYHARSDELVFLKATVGGWSNDVEKIQDPVVDIETTYRFSEGIAQWTTARNTAITQPGSPLDRQLREALGVYYMSGWERPSATSAFVIRNDSGGNPLTIYGKRLDAGYLDLATDGTYLIRPKWETLSTISAIPRENVIGSNLREYTYAVVPSPNGMGRLVRAHTVPTLSQIGVDVGQCISASAGKAMMVDHVLSDNVVRVRFRTRRHEEMPINQVRMTIYLAKRLPGPEAVITYRTIEAAFNMGIRGSADDQYFDTLVLGPVVPIPLSKD